MSQPHQSPSNGRCRRRGPLGPLGPLTSVFPALVSIRLARSLAATAWPGDTGQLAAWEATIRRVCAAVDERWRRETGSPGVAGPAAGAAISATVCQSLSRRSRRGPRLWWLGWLLGFTCRLQAKLSRGFSSFKQSWGGFTVCGSEFWLSCLQMPAEQNKGVLRPGERSGMALQAEHRPGIVPRAENRARHGLTGG